MDRAVATSSTAHSLTVARIEGRAARVAAAAAPISVSGRSFGGGAGPAELDDPAGPPGLGGADPLLFLAQHVQGECAVLQRFPPGDEHLLRPARWRLVKDVGVFEHVFEHIASVNR